MDEKYEVIKGLFNRLFPHLTVKQLWKKGPDAIRVRCGDIFGTRQDLIFTYVSACEWTLETVDMHEKRKKTE